MSATVFDVAFTPASAPAGVAGSVAVVIDVLRMTTNAATLFSLGLSELFVVAEIEEARAVAGASGALLFGERGGVPLPGFNGGNSPLEHTGDLAGRKALLCTTNGSFAVQAVKDARAVLLGAIVNAGSVAQRALQLGAERVLLVCAGTNGSPSLDDVVGAGCIVRAALRGTGTVALTDSAKMALHIANQNTDLEATLLEAAHAAVLEGLGYDRDIAFAARLDSLPVAPERTAADPATFRLLG